MAVTAYVTYELFWLNGEGHQPYQTVLQKGMGFDGGLFAINNTMFGYLTGNSNKKAETIAACAAFQMVEITTAEALFWAEQSLPINTQNSDGLYAGPAELDQDGYIIRNWLQEPYNANNI